MAFPELIGGRVVTARGEILKSREDLERFGLIAQQTLLDGICHQLFGTAAQTPLNGVWPGSFELTHVSERVYSLSPGLGLMEFTPEAEDEPAYRLIHNPAVVEFEVPEPSQPTYERYDLILLKPGETTEQEFRDVKNFDVVPPTLTPTEIDVLTRPSWNSSTYYLQGVEGVAPEVPEVPPGYQVAWEIKAYGSSAFSVVALTDRRQLLAQLGEVARRVDTLSSRTIILDGAAFQLLTGGPLSYDGVTGGINATNPGIMGGLLKNPLQPGQTISGVRLFAFRDSGTLSLRIKRKLQGQDMTDWETLTISGGTGYVTVSSSTVLTLAEGESLVMELTFNNGGVEEAIQFERLEVDVSTA